MILPGGEDYKRYCITLYAQLLRPSKFRDASHPPNRNNGHPAGSDANGRAARNNTLQLLHCRFTLQL